MEATEWDWDLQLPLVNSGVAVSPAPSAGTESFLMPLKPRSLPMGVLVLKTMGSQREAQRRMAGDLLRGRETDDSQKSGTQSHISQKERSSLLHPTIKPHLP